MNLRSIGRHDGSLSANRGSNCGPIAGLRRARFGGVAVAIGLLRPRWRGVARSMGVEVEATCRNLTVHGRDSCRVATTGRGDSGPASRRLVAEPTIKNDMPTSAGPVAVGPCRIREPQSVVAQEWLHMCVALMTLREDFPLQVVSVVCNGCAGALGSKAAQSRSSGQAFFTEVGDSNVTP